MARLYAIVVDRSAKSQAEAILNSAKEKARQKVGVEDPFVVTAEFEVASGMTMLQKQFRAISIADSNISIKDALRITTDEGYREEIKRQIAEWVRAHSDIKDPEVIYLDVSFDKVQDPPLPSNSTLGKTLVKALTVAGVCAGAGVAGYVIYRKFFRKKK